MKAVLIPNSSMPSAASSAPISCQCGCSITPEAPRVAIESTDCAKPDLAMYATLQLGAPYRVAKAEFNPWVGYKTRVEDVTYASEYSVDDPAEVLK
jgi:hypothetical protein